MQAVRSASIIDDWTYIKKSEIRNECKQLVGV